MTTKNLFGDAKSLYEEILREIELDIEKDHFFSEQASKEMIMSAIAKALQNKFVIVLGYDSWKHNTKEASAVCNEKEFVDELHRLTMEFYGDTHAHLEEMLNKAFFTSKSQLVETKVAVFYQSSSGESAQVVNVKCSRTDHECGLASVIAQNYILKSGVGQYPTFAITENEDKELVEALVSMGRILDA